jgi:glycosyltransferase involved in cell wall biosynthesis
VAEELVRLLPPALMRVGFHDPYLAILGGGEKYLLTILEQVADEDPDAGIVVFAPSRPDPARWERLGVHVAPGAFRWLQAGPLEVTRRSARLDLLVTITNHFPPLSLARRSVAIVQFPFAGLGGARGLERRLRLRSYDTILCYSEFVREHIAARLGIADAVVISPPVDTGAAAPGPKGRSVIAVGRFFPATDANNKKHGVLIDAFARLCTQADGWRLNLVGGLHDDPGSHAYLAGLREQAAGLPVSFHPNAEPAEVARLYGDAALFWHATGFGETQPERLEHFGITTVEAMAWGCVPVVPALGGQLEIVADGRNGRLWRSVDELVGASLELIRDPERAAVLRAAAVADAQRFTKSRFREQVRERVLDPAGVAGPARTPG